MSKLAFDDIKILDEGQQVKELIESKYGSLREFYKTEQPKGLSLKAIRNYCSYPLVRSETFKLILVEKLAMGWDEIILKEADQIKLLVKNVYDNYVLYKNEEDIKTFERLIQYCNEYNLIPETAIVYRCMAKNYYLREKMNKTIELYEKAIRLCEQRHYNVLIILHAELAYYLYTERDIIASEKHYNIAEAYTRQEGAAPHPKYTYYYRRAIILNSSGQHSKARELFNKALENATDNGKSISETGSVVTAIGTTYKREGDYEKAKDYYFKSLLYYDESNFSGLGTTFNNIADIFCLTGDYEKAAYYIEKALPLVNKAGIIHSLLICAETYAEIKLKCGDVTGCYKYFDLLTDIANTTTINKKKMKDSICRMIDMLNGKELLHMLDYCINCISMNTSNELFKDELYSCIGRLCLKLNKKEVYNEKAT